MLIHVISDSSTRLAGVRTVLERRHAVTSELLGGLSIQRGNIQALVVRADLQSIETICTLKKILASLSRVQKRIFVVENAAHLSVSQAYALGATSVLSGPLNSAKLLKEVDGQTPADEAPAAAPGSSEAAAASGEIAFASMFTAIAAGTPIDVANIKNAGAEISAAVEEHGLANWLATVRRHHEGTYQHCLLVTGVAVDFGLSLGFPKCQVERLYSSAMFHDIGKATIPLAVLDKPGRLDPQERALIETHPVAGYNALKDTTGISAEILDAVRHHHEYLDGSGYPDKLCAESITDLVRVMTISDIFAALIEARPYRATMSRADAYNILRDMNGKLEKPLVNAFKAVALSR
ncbi:MAG: HD domain-containing protein [Bradyrhizobium sp.]|nr:HD domain-containing protein [Bradyrhizobium sp.]